MASYNFDQCFEWLMDHEGGYVDHPEDPGGATNLGVTLATWERWTGCKATKADIRGLTVQDVKPLYRALYWNRVKGDDLADGIDWAVFDFAVNSGPGRAARALQQALGVKEDGIIGPVTLDAMLDFDTGAIVWRIFHIRQRFFQSIKTFPTFGRGWTKRNESVLGQALQLVGK